MPDIRDILKALNIPFEDGGSKAVNVHCPFCNDRKFHCGIFLDKHNYFCWRCKTRGGLFHLLHHMTALSLADYRRLTQDAKPLLASEQTASQRIHAKFTDAQTEPWVHPGKIELPGRLVDWRLCAEYPALRQFIEQRKVSMASCDNGGARYVGPVGDYANRLILPIWDDRFMPVTFQARDVTGQAKQKYLNPHGRPLGDWLYWSSEDMDGEPMYLVEGIFDVWRMEYNAVAGFGKNLTRRQRAMLIEEDPERLIIAWDADAYGDALEVGRSLANILKSVGVVRLPDGMDPDSMGREAIERLEVRWL